MIFRSALRLKGDRAGVFECDDAIGYFYLYDRGGTESPRILGAIPVVVGRPSFVADDVSIRWNATESIVGLFIHEHLCAAFDGDSGERYGGRSNELAVVDVQPEIAAAFRS